MCSINNAHALIPEPIMPPPSPEELAQRIRTQRDALIRQNVDCYNGARWETLSTNRKTFIKNYRQALLDITLQETFPQSVIWPNKPE